MQTATTTATPMPFTLDEALDRKWLTHALQDLTGGAEIRDVDVVQVIRHRATKVRFKATWADGSADLCLKAFLEVDKTRPSPSWPVEARFYAQIAPHLDVRMPTCVSAISDDVQCQGVVIMRDLIAEGARFCSALEPFTLDEAAANLEQLARLNASTSVLDRVPWLSRKVAELVSWQVVSTEKLQELLDGPRGQGLDAATRDAERLVAAMGALSELDARQPATLIHGDFHAGNSFRTKDGPGLIDWQMIQKGGWAIDVAYHLGAALPVEMAEAHEWELVDHYLDVARGLGMETPDTETAREQYRAAMVYGYYMWGITLLIDPTIIATFTHRLGSAVARHDSFRLLGV